MTTLFVALLLAAEGLLLEHGGAVQQPNRRAVCAGGLVAATSFASAPLAAQAAEAPHSRH